MTPTTRPPAAIQGNGLKTFVRCQRAPPGSFVLLEREVKLNRR